MSIDAYFGSIEKAHIVEYIVMYQLQDSAQTGVITLHASVNNHQVLMAY